MVGIRSGTEEPRYKLVATIGDIQIRQYAPRLAATTTVQADEIAARSLGFRRIARYIFGANQSNTSISMTAPVEQSSSQSSKIAMTAPVAQTQTSPGSWTISFFMPAKYTLANLPKPLDPTVVIVEVPAETYAVYRFSGVPSVGPVKDAHAKLLAGLAKSGWTPSGDIFDWFYDPPWTIPFARRNEAAVLVAQVVP
ncbi:MAG: heme-binding protein [Negativicutes bacterium]|nr:heme-binding protein [Negativicutes bacterium]